MKKTAILFWLSVYAAFGFAQTAGDTYQVFNKQTVQGLSNTINTAILFDTSGNLWAGSNEGLIKFDGTQWQVYTNQNSSLKHNSISALAIDSKNNLWMTNGYNEGLIKFDGINNWTFYSPSNSSLQSAQINDIVADRNDHIWMATSNKGLIELNGTDFISYNKENGVLPASTTYRLYIGSTGEKWVVCGDNWGIVRLSENNSATPYQETKMKTFTNILKDAQGSLWAGTYFSGAMNLNDNAWRVPSSILGSELSGVAVWSLGKDKEGSLLLGTIGYGLWKYKSGVLSHIGADIDLVKYATINAIAMDKQGNTWLGTADIGIVRIKTSEITAVKKLDVHESKSIVYFPNPNVGGMLQGSYVADESEVIHVNVYDISGRMITQYQHNLSKGNNIFQYNFSDMTCGIYFMQVNYRGTIITRKVSILN